MRIKASGQRIKDINNNLGFVDLNYLKINQSLRSNLVNKNQNDFFIDKNCDAKMSIEAYFHSVLKKIVLHTHPIQLNAVLASKDAYEILKKLSGSINYIPYIKPGVLLGIEVQKMLNNNRENKNPCLVFYLQNHGVIISSDSVNEVIKESERLQVQFSDFLANQSPINIFDTLKNIFGSDNNFYPTKNLSLNTIINNRPYLINYLATNPDTVIFCGPKPFIIDPKKIDLDLKLYLTEFKTYPKIIIINNKIYYIAKSEKEAGVIEEVFLSHVFIIENCPKNINYLSYEEIHNLVQRDDEKYRINLIR